MNANPCKNDSVQFYNEMSMLLLHDSAINEETFFYNIFKQNLFFFLCSVKISSYLDSLRFIFVFYYPSAIKDTILKITQRMSCNGLVVWYPLFSCRYPVQSWIKNFNLISNGIMLYHSYIGAAQSNFAIWCDGMK